MPDILLLITLTFIFLSVPILIFLMGATVIFAGLYLLQFYYTQNFTALLFSAGLIAVFFVEYIVFRKLRKWIKR